MQSTHRANDFSPDMPASRSSLMIFALWPNFCSSSVLLISWSWAIVFRASSSLMGFGDGAGWGIGAVAGLGASWAGTEHAAAREQTAVIKKVRWCIKME